MSEEAQGAVQPKENRSLLGPRPGLVIVNLVVVSLAVGFMLSLFNFDVRDLIRGAAHLLRDTLRDGAGTLRLLIGYVLAGAVIVVPAWLLLRLTRGR